MQKITLIVLILLIGLYSCNKQKNEMTAAEIELIRSDSVNAPFYVLQTTEKVDSLFLRMKAKDFDSEAIASDTDLQLLIERMKVTLEVEQGVGLAAPQVGISRNLFLFMRIDKVGYPVQVAINPKIVNYPNDTICFEGDGCLSIPNMSGNSIRYPWVEVEYYDEKGFLHKEKLSGYSRETDFTGIIFQHEYDHLEGVLFIDKLCEEKSDELQKED